RVKEERDIAEVVATGREKRRPRAIGEVRTGKGPAPFQTPEVVEVVAQTCADEGRVVLSNAIRNQVVHHHTADECAEVERAVAPARANQRLAEADVPVRVVWIAVREPGFVEPRMHELV